MASRFRLRLSLALLLTSLLGVLPTPLAAQQVHYEYDALGRLTLVSTPEGVAIYEYDAVGNILRITIYRYDEASGLYTAPATLPSSQPSTTEAVRKSDPGQVATARVQVVGQAAGLTAAAPLAVGVTQRAGAAIGAGPVTVGVTPGSGGPAYGGAAFRPLLAGSGGGGGTLIASSVSIGLGTNSGTVAIQANGGAGGTVPYSFGGAGSGGAIRLIAPTISGVGQLLAKGSTSGTSASPGRIRLEASTLTYTGTTTPVASSAFPRPVFPPAGQPRLTITSVGGLAAPAQPVGSILAAPDILLPVGTTSSVAVTLAASNIPLGTAIQVTATPQTGSKRCALSGRLSGSLASSTATASLTLELAQVSVLMASATFPLVASEGGGPVYAEGPSPSLGEGDEVTHVRVAAVMGEAAQVTYITKSGREIIAQ